MKRKLTLLLLSLNALLAGATIHGEFSLSESDSILSKAREQYPKYVAFLPSNKLDSILEYKGTDVTPITFQVNKVDLEENEQLKNIVSVINKLRKDEHFGIGYIWIAGSASPEGPIDGNKRLGKSRAEALADYLKRETHLEDVDIRIENIWEDWASLSLLLSKQDFPNKEKVIQIIANEEKWDQRKLKIKRIDKRKTWNLLLHEMFPKLRNARMVIVCSVKESPVLSDMSVSLSSEEIAVEAPPISSPDIELPTITTMAEDRFFALKTNGLYLGALIANIGFEVELWRKWSLDVPVWYSPYDYTPTRKIRLLATQPELRFWPKKAGKGHFFGLHTHIVGFNVAINDNGRYQDPNHALWGAGFSYGYTFHLDKSQKWSLEFNLGAGFAEYDYDVYRNWANGPKFNSGSDFYWGITRAGISIAYKFYKPRTK
ncbi:DUF3575 domain-containing protein [Porphyromonas crevioricanis]|uniref:DUF3575 domain-containing protein n=1 Tax=Porphyromonas crevioricanis TaxID=393921 RepID=A0AB34PGU9_9PORP|nr:DUF3575 domain-containing protein [Porphyromonas crevioricanis]KGN94951.1 hypothetical protein HQ38_05390 [Porphyromonas crevioricanis]